MATFGSTSTAGAGASGLKDNVNGIHNPAPADSGTLYSISAYITITLGRGQEIYIKAALYTVSGTTYTLVGETDERHWGGLGGEAAPSGYTWLQFDFASPPSIVGGTNYALMVWAGNGTPTVVSLKYDSSGTYKLTIKAQTYNGFPGYTQTPASFYPAIYGTYSTTAPGPPVGSLALLGVGV